MCVPLVVTFAFRWWSHELFFFFATVGLLFAVSGLRKGGPLARLCAAASLAVFALLAFAFLTVSRWY
jgi:hypothetical protein